MMEITVKVMCERIKDDYLYKIWTDTEINAISMAIKDHHTYERVGQIVGVVVVKKY